MPTLSAVAKSDEPDGKSPSQSSTTRAAEDLVDAATGFDGRAWVTLRDLVLKPWEMIQRAAFDHDPTYVGAVKLSLAMSTFAIVLMSWLFPGDAQLDNLETSNPEAWIELNARLTEHGICFAHFVDRFSSRYELLNTAATLLECGVFALLFRWFDRSRPLLSHLSFALYCYSLWLLASIPLELLLAAASAADLGQTLSMAVGVVMLGLLPGLLIAGLWHLYPAPWSRQLARALILVVVIAVLFGLTLIVIMFLAMAWALASFGL
ncbi:MAG: hypothetical protein K0V04_31405 [Deltaproteobacteria bacterium]|nr:hypothetical protein [Deltaproteobacteria bacterium]